MSDLSRRAFLACAPAVLLAPSLLPRLARAPVRILLVWAPAFENVKRGAELSAAEVQRAAGLLRREFTFSAMPAAEFKPDGAWTGIINATSPVINMSDTTIIDVTGTARCAPNVLQLVPDGCADDCTLWHDSLSRFGAEQLNDRFRAANLQIDDHLWLGWFAVKLLWEAGARDRAPRAMSYDGHKGVPLRFNDAGVLVQPAYKLNAGKVAGEITLGEDATCPS